MSTDFVETTKGASRGGFQGIKKVRGLLVSLKKVPPRFEESDFGPPKEQIEFVLEDAAILEMFPGEEEFELKENRFMGWTPYAVPGKTPHVNSSYMKCWVASAEKLSKKPSDFIGEYVTLEKIPVTLFKRPLLGDNKKVLLDEDGNKVYEEIIATNVFCFVANEEASSDTVREYVRDLVCGLNQKAALRKLLIDTRAKQFPEYKEALSNGTLADMLELTVVDGIFEKPEGDY